MTRGSLVWVLSWSLLLPGCQPEGCAFLSPSSMVVWWLCLPYSGWVFPPLLGLSGNALTDRYLVRKCWLEVSKVSPLKKITPMSGGGGAYL